VAHLEIAPADSPSPHFGLLTDQNADNLDSANAILALLFKHFIDAPFNTKSSGTSS